MKQTQLRSGKSEKDIVKEMLGLEAALENR